MLLLLLPVVGFLAKVCNKGKAKRRLARKGRALAAASPPPAFKRSRMQHPCSGDLLSSSVNQSACNSTPLHLASALQFIVHFTGHPAKRRRRSCFDTFCATCSFLQGSMLRHLNNAHTRACPRCLKPRKTTSSNYWSTLNPTLLPHCTTLFFRR